MPHDVPSLLVIDDNADVRFVLREVLSLEGAHVLTAGTGEEGFAVFRENPGIRLVLSDVRLPDCSGVDLARKLRDQRPSLPILLMTGLPVREHFAAITDLVMLQKPIDLDELENMLGKYIA